MIISALCEYYDYMRRSNKILPEGYSEIPVTHTVSLTGDGKIAEIIPEVISDNKKKIYPVCLFPKRTDKSAIDANIVEHRPLYLFGLEASGESFFESGKAKKSHAAFVAKNESFFEGMEHPLAKAFLNFIKNWNPSSETENNKLKTIVKEFNTSVRFAFTLFGKPTQMLQDIPEVKTKWELLFAEKSADNPDDVMTAQCPVTGEVLPTARLHDKIKGIRGGQPSGCALVCFNNEAENSYGKQQSYNSAISEKAMEQYTEALNFLLKSNDHSVYVTGTGMTIVHFAMTADDSDYVRSVKNCIFDVESDEYDPLDAKPEEMDSPEAATEKDIREIFNRDIEVFAAAEKVDAQHGKMPKEKAVVKKRRNSVAPEFDVRCDDDVKYCIFGIVPNASRLSVRFYYLNTFGELKKNVEKYHADFAIGDRLYAPSVWMACKALQRTGSKDEEIPSDYAICFLDAILNGARLPVKILSAAVRRVRTDCKTDGTRAGIIKACLVRKNKKYKEKIKMGLNTENHDAAYLCGRLFAVLEKIQIVAAGGELNRTVKDTYFTSASATPAAIFARMIQLSQKHLAKIENKTYAKRLDDLVKGIVDNLESFPKTLSIEEQAEFILGYYQQKDFYIKKSDKKEEI